MYPSRCSVESNQHDVSKCKGQGEKRSEHDVFIGVSVRAVTMENKNMCDRVTSQIMLAGLQCVFECTGVVRLRKRIVQTQFL